MIVPVTSRPHYRAHLAPVLDLIAHAPERRTDDDVALVASYPDLDRARRLGFRRFVLAQHGIGQSYSSTNPAYPGGERNGDVGLFLVPNEHAAGRWRAAYPHAAVEVVGCPRLDDLPARQPGPGPVVAISFHWDARLVPETRSAFRHYAEVIPDLAQRFRLIGHAHPLRRDLAKRYRKMGVEFVPDFDEVCRRADVYVADNTSSMYEFAATGRPVVVLNAPWYRRDVSHGLRYWEAARIGVNCDSPADLVATVDRALDARPDDVAAREEALSVVYAHRTGAARRAADAVTTWL